MRGVLSALALFAATVLRAQTSCPTKPPSPWMVVESDYPRLAGTPLNLVLQAEIPECAPVFCPTIYGLQACDVATWHFGDGTPDVTVTGVSGNFERVAHTYATPGLVQPTVTITNSLGTSQAVAYQAIVVTSNPPTYVDFSPYDITVPETAGSITFTLVRSGNLTTTANVHYKHRTGGFPSLEQAEPLDGDITFAPGETTKSFTMKIFDDHAYTEPYTDSVFITMTDGTVSHASEARFTLTEVTPQPTATVSSDVRVAEGTETPNTADIVVTMSAPIRGTTVEFLGWPTDGTAKFPSDYGQDAVCDIPEGSVQCVIKFPIVNDDVPEPDETFTVKVKPVFSVAAPIMIRDTATVTIVNDDSAITPPMMQIVTGTHVSLKVDIGQAPSAPLTIPLQSSSPEVVDVPASVTFQPGQSTATFSAHALGAGLSRITAAVPGTNVPSSLITVVDAITIVADPPAITLHAGSDGNVSLSIQPPRANAESVTVASTSPDVATAPASLTIPADGNATLTIHALKSGFGTIRIVTPDGLTFSIDVTVVDGPAPSATQIDPPKGPSTGGTTTTIIGQGLDAQCGVSFGAAAGTNVTAVSNGIRVVVPPHEPGTVDVSVTCGATRIVLPNAFTFFAPRRRAAG